MVVLNPSIPDMRTFESMDWKPLLIAHKKRSSVIEVTPDSRYLRKTKKRKGHNRDIEFYNLAFWRCLFDLYDKETKSKVYSPQPYASYDRSVIMEYVHGIDLDRLLLSASISSNNLQNIVGQVGRLQKIKENEDLLHNDFDLRHVLVNGGLYVIDLENAQYGNGKVVEENKKLTARIKDLFKGDIDKSLQEGLQSVPKLSLFDAALESVKKVYGGRAEYYLKDRYRNQAYASDLSKLIEEDSV